LLAENGRLQRQLDGIRHVDWEGTIATLREEVAQLQHVRDDQKRALQGLVQEHNEHEIDLRRAAEAGVCGWMPSCFHLSYMSMSGCCCCYWCRKKL